MSTKDSSEVTKIYSGTPQPGDRYLILLHEDELNAVIDDWTYRCQRCDLRIRRAKTPSHVVIELEDTVYAATILQWHPSAKVEIRHAGQ